MTSLPTLIAEARELARKFVGLPNGIVVDRVIELEQMLIQLADACEARCRELEERLERSTVQETIRVLNVKLEQLGARLEKAEAVCVAAERARDPQASSLGEALKIENQIHSALEAWRQSQAAKEGAE